MIFGDGSTRVATLSAYRELAHRLLREATGTEDPAKAERFKKRANEYLLLADAIEASEPLLMPSRQVRRFTNSTSRSPKTPTRSRSVSNPFGGWVASTTARERALHVEKTSAEELGQASGIVVMLPAN